MSVDSWLLIAHVFSVMAWMAGLWYLPRLFVYHVDAKPPLATTLCVMESRLLRGIMNPAMIGVWVLGLTMLWRDPGLLQQPWMHTKLTLVVLMTVFHMVLARWRRQLQNGHSTRTARFYRWANEIPTVLVIGILVLVIGRPF